MDTIHICFQALSEYESKNNGNKPRPWNRLDAKTFVETANCINLRRPSPFESLNEKVLELFSYVCAGSLCPVQALIGGLVAQEAMKACSGKFHPIVQYFYYDCRECLPEEYVTDENEFILDEPNRYQSQISVFGKQFQKKLENLKCFLVGSGALGW